MGFHETLTSLPGCMGRLELVAPPDQVPGIPTHEFENGYHYDGSPRRFFEGWYFRVTLPGDDGQSFAFMYSIEDPAGSSVAGVGAQVMGPGDTYLVQHSPERSSFWASPHQLALGNSFKATGRAPPRMLSAAEFSKRVGEGFQVSTTWHQGELRADPGGSGPGPLCSASSIRWAYSTTPVYGWGGGASGAQESTAGWLVRNLTHCIPPQLTAR
ncbi:tocopherol cyclase, partial [Cymbomonas tetramitiformis]